MIILVNIKNPRNGTELCWGRQPVLTLLSEFPSKCVKVLLSESADKTFSHRVEEITSAKNIVLEKVHAGVLEKLSKGENHQGIVVRMEAFEPIDLDDFIHGLDPDKPSMLIILDHIQDPHNLGAIIRSAEAAGASGVIFPSKRSSSPTGTVIKISAGSALRVPLICVVNISRTLQLLQKAGFWIVGLDHNGERGIWEDDMPSRLGLVVGSEGEGLSRLAASKCDELRSIPMSGKTASLNASVAAAIGMYEWTREFMGKIS